jgi:hypothetical protein
VRLEQVHGQGRDQGSRQDERGDHREDHGLGHRHEQEARHALEHEHRHEDDADAEQGDEGRRHDLLGAVEDGLAHALAVLQVPVDVLDGHRGVVDQDADGQGQAAQGHDVQRLMQGRQGGDGRQHGQGIEIAMITVERQLPRNSRIITLVRAAAITPSLMTPLMAPFTNTDWSFSGVILKSSGRVPAGPAGGP